MRFFLGLLSLLVLSSPSSWASVSRTPKKLATKPAAEAVEPAIQHPAEYSVDELVQRAFQMSFSDPVSFKRSLSRIVSRAQNAVDTLELSSWGGSSSVYTSAISGVLAELPLLPVQDDGSLALARADQGFLTETFAYAFLQYTEMDQVLETAIQRAGAIPDSVSKQSWITRLQISRDSLKSLIESVQDSVAELAGFSDSKMISAIRSGTRFQKIGEIVGFDPAKMRDAIRSSFEIQASASTPRLVNLSARDSLYDQESWPSEYDGFRPSDSFVTELQSLVSENTDRLNQVIAFYKVLEDSVSRANQAAEACHSTCMQSLQDWVSSKVQLIQTEYFYSMRSALNERLLFRGPYASLIPKGSN